MTSESKIPKIIHYCWFGQKPKPQLVVDCIASWKNTCPSFTIKEWNESNYDVHTSPFSSRMYNSQKWAFVADYARLTILEKEGGVYLDTDMELVQDLSPLLSSSLLLGEEEKGIISAGMVGATPNHPYIRACKEKYNTITGLPPTIPRLMTEVFISMKANLHDIQVCPPITFYPYTQNNISEYKKEKLTSLTYGVHLWNYSWGHPLNRFFKKIGIHRIGTNIVTALGIKSILKKILGFS